MNHTCDAVETLIPKILVSFAQINQETETCLIKSVYAVIKYGLLSRVHVGPKFSKFCPPLTQKSHIFHEMFAYGVMWRSSLAKKTVT